MALLDNGRTPEEWADELSRKTGRKVSARFIREKAKAQGACEKLGRVILLTQAHVESLFEPPCPLKSTNEESSGTSEAVLKAAVNISDEALAHLMKRSQGQKQRK